MEEGIRKLQVQVFKVLKEDNEMTGRAYGKGMTQYMFFTH